ncbi:MAG: hypoxanthine phosphoribosyltransferase [Bacteroidales bacterium]|nr:hypoxanthine phosphoribosyltransferase [Bacteroidales bacterium]MBR5781029.1 hypoxanthine phosphoribosyltransferase [Bacteroidales bacterium]
MNTIKVLDKEFKLYIKQEEIETVIKDIANQINEEYKDRSPLFLVMLNGAFMFASQLFKELTIDCETSFVKYASYDGTQRTCEVKELIGLKSSLEGRDVVIIEDIIDSGYTMKCIIQKLKDMKVSSVKIATMLFKPNAFKFDYKIDYIGFNIDNEFIVGYGLDYNEHGRNYGSIYKVVE